MAALVTLEEARRHLRLTPSNMEDADVAADVAGKAEAATDIVIDYIKKPAHGWTHDTAPWRAKAAILLVLGALFDDREGGDPLSEAVKSLLHRLRDPALA
jgi:hypothetical protein